MTENRGDLLESTSNVATTPTHKSSKPEATSREQSAPSFPALRYHPEIDGLRAVAIVVVILFHSRLACPGGYVGVDVFFVISGYLITSLILRGISKSEFSALEFWERRVRRIAPAMIFTIFASLVAGWFLCWPNDFERFGYAVIAQVLFLSNAFHWRVAGYFGTDAEVLPLLHTWSLAVEEQFYIVLPPLLLLIGAWRKRWLSSSILVGFIASLAFSIYATPKYPEFSFYLLPTRAWEMLVGALIAAYPIWPALRSGWVRELISCGGLIAIVISVATYNSSTPFPGASALLPCLGSGAFIMANCAGSTIGGKLLAMKPFVFIGQISYSLYLVHWPVFVFSSYLFGDAISSAGTLGLITLTFVLGTLSWAIVETPVRKKWILSQRWKLFAFAAGSLLLQMVLGAVIVINHGFPSRFDPQVSRYNMPEIDKKGTTYQTSLRAAVEGRFRDMGSSTGEIRCLLWGDSHAMAISPAVEYACQSKGVRGLQATHSSTAPLLDFIHWSRYSLNEDSPKFNDAVVQFAIDKHVQVVVMAGYWSDYTSDPRFESCVRRTVDALAAADIQVVIVKDVPFHSGNVPRVLARAAHLHEPVDKIGISLESHRERNKIADNLFDSLAGPKVKIVDTASRFTDKTGLCRAEFDGEALYYDAQHLSRAGALRLAPLFEQVLGNE